jgi:hypothetical protein
VVGDGVEQGLVGHGLAWCLGVRIPEDG